MDRPDFFKVNRADIIWYLFRDVSVSLPIWIAIGVSLILVVVGAFIDWRLLVLGIAVALTVIPGAAFFIYFSHMLDTQTIANVLPHTVESYPGGYLVKIFREEVSEDENGDQHHDWIEYSHITIFDSRVKKRTDMSYFSVLQLEDSPINVLYIPKGMEPKPLYCQVKNHTYQHENS